MSRLTELADKLSGIYEGADATEVPEGVYATTAQLWYRLLESPPEKRFQILEGLHESAMQGLRCFMEQHDRR